MTSKSQVNRSGEVLRLARLDPNSASDKDKLDAFEVVETFRRGFSYPLTKVNNGLRSFVQSVSGEVLVAQRLKRMPQIIHKLERLPGTQLARMEDIGGCRAVLQTQDQVNRVAEKIMRQWNMVRPPRDYVSVSKPSGYRAIHLIIERDDHRLEVQLRTKGQQTWANVVEKVAAVYRLPLKDEKGPDEVMNWLRLAAENIAYSERQETPPKGFSEEFTEAVDVALEWMMTEEEK
jgi:putative GTP pyrophosphokinase